MTPFRSEKNTNWEGAYPRPAPRALAGQDRGRRAFPTKSSSITTGCRRFSPWQASPTSSRSEEGAQGRRQDLQGASRWLQPVAIPDRQGGEEPAPGLRLFQRRRRHRGAALRQLESRLHRSSGSRGRMRIWAEPFVQLRVPKVFNLRTDPYERADITSNSYYEWFLCTRLHRAGGDDAAGAVPRDVQGVPAAPEARRRSRSTRRMAR